MSAPLPAPPDPAHDLWSSWTELLRHADEDDPHRAMTVVVAEHDFGTVCSTLLALPRDAARAPVLLFANGPPTRAPYVAIEALGSCNAITDAGSKFPDNVPVLLMAGDPIVPGAPPPFGVESCRKVAAANPKLKLTVDYLPEAGVRGNSHMMMLDRNNKQIADRIMIWIDRARAGKK